MKALNILFYTEGSYIFNITENHFSENQRDDFMRLFYIPTQSIMGLSPHFSSFESINQTYRFYEKAQYLS